MRNFFVALSLLFFGAMSAQAMPIVSGSGNETCNQGTCYLVPQHPAWHDPDGTAQWVSAFEGFMEPHTSFGYTLSFYSSGREHTLHIYGDDTVGTARIDGESIPYFNGVGKNLTQDICARGAIGCEDGEQGILVFTVDRGWHTLSLEVYQVGEGTNSASNPNGVLVEDQTASAVPIPAAAPLMGMMMMGMVYMSRRRHS